MLDGRVDAFARHSIAGWAADMDRPELQIDIVVMVDGQAHGHIKADLPRDDLADLGTLGDGAHGFLYTFDPPLSSWRTYEVAVCYAGTEQPLRLGRFTMVSESGVSESGVSELPEPPPLKSGSDGPVQRIRPIMVTTSGQPGFINLMRGLTIDPAIVAASSHAYGIKLVTYYAHALEVLTAPSGPASSSHAVAIDEDGLLLGPNPFHAAAYEGVFPEPYQLYDFFQNQASARIRGAFSALIADYYTALARHQGRENAVWFAEQSDLFDVARIFARAAFTDIREIVLLQDPRDAYCGYRALWSVSPAQAMDTLRKVRDSVVKLRLEERADTCFLRVEDLRLRPDSVMAEISGFLSLDHVITVDAETIEAAVVAASDPASTLGIGRWKTELENDEIVMFDREFGEFLLLFGYELAVSTHS